MMGKTMFLLIVMVSMTVKANSIRREPNNDSISVESIRKPLMNSRTKEHSTINTAKNQTSTYGLVNISNQTAHQDGKSVSQQDKVVFLDEQDPINEEMLHSSEKTIVLEDRTSLDVPKICDSNQKVVQGKCRILYKL